MIATQLELDHEVIDIDNRAQLLDDAFILALGNHLDYKIALELTRYLDAETSYSPWHAVLPELDYIHFMMLNPPVFAAWQVCS